MPGAVIQRSGGAQDDAAEASAVHQTDADADRVQGARFDVRPGREGPEKQQQYEGRNRPFQVPRCKGSGWSWRRLMRSVP